MAWVMGGAGIAVVCLGVGAVAVRHWVKPEPGVVPTPAAQRAELERMEAARDETAPLASEASENPAEPASFIPWAWLDQPPRPDLPWSNADDAPALVEQTASLSVGEIQRVTGIDAPDAGANDAPPKPSAPELSETESAQPALEPALQPEQAALQPEQTAAEPPPPGESCGFVTCQAGYDCCNPSCGVCVAPGESCDPTPCESRIQYPVSFLCGRATCSVGEVCCNASCGTCVEPGESCDQNPCDNAIQYPSSQMCGRVTCSVGQECCNPSCGICVSPGESCSQQWCE